MKTPLVLDKLDSQGDFFIEKIKAALSENKEEISWKYCLADRVIFYHACKNICFQNLA